jgi:sensor domain CHASE-containing protein
MTLKKKILGLVLVLMTVTAIMDFAIHRWVIYPTYTAMEQAQAQKDLARCVAALQSEIGHLDAFANDWAAWDDTYRFMSEQTKAFIVSNLGPQTFLDNALNLMAFYDLNGNQVWSRTYNLATGHPAPIHPFSAPSLAPTHPLLNRAGADMPIRGIFVTDQGPILIASRAIVTSARQGPVKGSLIMGRIAPHQGHGGGLLGQSGVTVQGHGEIGADQGRGVVDAVAHHHHLMAFGLQRFHIGRFAQGQQPACGVMKGLILPLHELGEGTALAER